MDFSPLAVERRQGLGRVAKEPSTIKITEFWLSKKGVAESLTTSLPYVEVVSDRTIGNNRIWVDKDRIYLSCGPTGEIEVIEMML
ncbi:hypothetical protein DFH29DRAFT_1001408 [Suillus ampliporus]|nr:hypothetical protein DFH29DRAFT_1001408 [Suillus ampliporus]